ncbi:MAG: CHC2 zinc finger domain-containing protein [Hyphomicrobiaceae bacterium]
MKRKSPLGVDFALIRRAVPLAVILSRYGLDDAFKRVGSRLKGVCPIHKGSNKRQFVIDPGTSTWRCFGDCDRGGGSLEFVAEMERVGIGQAARLIADWFAIPLSMKALSKPSERRKPMSGKPSHKAFAVEDRGEGDDKDAFWTRIGSVFAHADGKGYNIVLSALPINGRIVLREFTDDDAKSDEPPAAKRRR